MTPDNVAETAGGNLPPVLKGLALRAENVGWTVEEAEVAINELAQNLLDEMSLM
ncbi:hypothetical protein [Neorhizobium galegae]|uniref:hypothetical protein n=1 Tax=Neorhizobium galegae TaxID=399 RepID=UPI001FCCA1FF|nr:hypothetical protein [Neorhizobium galegae]MCQ1854577.1 hypothetical protein [Neorhizobium galegae]